MCPTYIEKLSYTCYISKGFSDQENNKITHQNIKKKRNELLGADGYVYNQLVIFNLKKALLK